MKYGPWLKVKTKGAPEWLQSREQNSNPVYRVYYVKLGYNIRCVIPGKFASWRDAEKVGEPLYEMKKKESKQKPGIADKLPNQVLCSDVVAEILKDKDRNGLADATFEQAEVFYRRHILPFLGGNVEENSVKGADKIFVEGFCEKASDLTPKVWKEYVDRFRSKNPDSPLFNHYKFFITLFRYSADHNLINQRYKLDYSQKRDDDKEEGMVISEEDVQKMIFRAVNRTWRNRIIIQRWTGARPGEVRNLRKRSVNVKGRRGKEMPWEPNLFFEGKDLKICFYEYDTKTKKDRSFYVESELVKNAVLDQMKRYPDSPYLFPNEMNHSRPMDRCLNGWHSTLAKAGVDPNYTPHDLRHTYLTDMFKTSNEWAIICYQAGLTLEMAQSTYLHMNAKDTRGIANVVASKTKIEVVA